MDLASTARATASWVGRGASTLFSLLIEAAPAKAADAVLGAAVDRGKKAAAKAIQRRWPRIPRDDPLMAAAHVALGHALVALAREAMKEAKARGAGREELRGLGDLLRRLRLHSEEDPGRLLAAEAARAIVVPVEKGGHEDSLQRLQAALAARVLRDSDPPRFTWMVEKRLGNYLWMAFQKQLADDDDLCRRFVVAALQASAERQREAMQALQEIQADLSEIAASLGDIQERMEAPLLLRIPAALPLDKDSELRHFLAAGQALIPLIGRGCEVGELLAWAKQGSRFAWRVLVGDGGVGKTRLAIEVAKELADCMGWDAGLLDGQGLERLAGHDGFSRWWPERPTFIAVDYAAAKADLLGKLLSRLAQPPPAGAAVRLLLVERHASLERGWLKQLFAGLGEQTRRLIEPRRREDFVLELHGLGDQAGEARQVVAAFAGAFAAAKGQEPPNIPKDAEVWEKVSKATENRPLYLQAAAIAACEEGPGVLVRWGKQALLDFIAGKEREVLARQVSAWHRGSTGGDRAPDSLVAVAERGVVLLFLGGPTQSKDETWLGLLEHAAKAPRYGVAAGDAADALAAVLGARGSPAILEPMAPDLVAAAVAVRCIRDNPAGLEEEVARVLGWKGREAWERTTRALHDLFGLGDYGETARTMAGWLKKPIQDLDLPGLHAIEGLLFDYSVMLNPLSVVLGETMLRRLEGSSDREELARVLNNLGSDRANVGDAKGALDAAQHAVEVYEALAKENPAAYLPDLAMSLNNLGIRLSEVGKKREALKPTKRAVEIREALAKENPAAYLPDLAMSLNNLGTCLSEVGKKREALKPTKRAVEVYEALAKENPAAYLPDLARSLGVLGSILQDVGRPADAAAAFLEGARRFAPLVPTAPYLADLLALLARDYLEACKAAGIDPEWGVLGEVAKRLPRPKGGRPAKGPSKKRRGAKRKG